MMEVFPGSGHLVDLAKKMSYHTHIKIRVVLPEENASSGRVQ